MFKIGIFIWNSGFSGFLRYWEYLYQDSLNTG